MKKKYSIFIGFIFLSLLVLLILYGQLGTITASTNDGFILYGKSSSLLTPFSCTINSCSNDYWTFHSDNSNIANKPSGNDYNVIIQSITDSSNVNRNTYIQTQDIKNLNFKTEIESYSELTAGVNQGGSDSYIMDFYLISSNGQNIKVYSKPTTINKESGLIEIYPSLLYPDKLYFSYKGILIDIFDVSSFTDVKLKIVLNPIGKGKSTLNLKNTRTRLLFSCYLSSKDVIVLEKFKNTDLNIKSFTYPVKKFCYEHPAYVQNYYLKGSTIDLKNEIYNEIASGNSLDVPFDKEFGIFYITDKDTSILNCELNEIFDVKLNKCVKSSEIYIIKEEVNTQSYDLKYNYKCNELRDNKLCKYYTPQFAISNLDIASSDLKYICRDSSFIYPEPYKTCWKSVLTLNGIDYTIESEQTTKLSNGLSVYMKPKAIVKNGIFQNADDWEIDYYFDIDENIITLKLDELKDNIILNEEYKPKLIINNDLADGIKLKVDIKVTNTLLLTEKVESQTFTINKGENNIYLELPSNKLGNTNIIITGYISINDYIGKTNEIYTNYYVNQLQTSINPTEDIVKIDTFKNNFAYIYLCMFIFLLILYLIYKFVR